MSYYFNDKSLKDREKLFDDLVNLKIGDLVSYTLDGSKNKIVYGIVCICKPNISSYHKWYDITIISESRLMSLIINIINVGRLKNIKHSILPERYR